MFSRDEVFEFIVFGQKNSTNLSCAMCARLGVFMKKSLLLVFSLFSAMMVGCATTAYHKAENQNPDGTIKVAFGNKDGVHVGDKVNAYEQKCSTSGRGASRCKFILMGTLTLSQVEESASIAKPIGDLQLREGYIFKLEKHCEANPKECEP